MKFSWHKPVAAALFGASFAMAASAVVITKNSGSTTPQLSDFSAAFTGHPTKVGYGVFPDNHMFLETFKLECKEVSSATYRITVRRGGGGSANDSLSVWHGGTASYLKNPIWGGEPAGTTITLTGPVTGLTDHFSFAVQDDTSVMSASLEYTCVKRGLTFGTYPQNAVTGMATVACQGTPGPDCNPYQGDQLCTVPRPMLCMKSSGLSAPPGGSDHWSGNVIATTEAMLPPATLTAANNACSTRFGGGWVVAEFHAGGGWKFGAYGDVGDKSTRSWVDVKDQANGTCWNRN